jgi:hypothetical protein
MSTVFEALAWWFCISAIASPAIGIVIQWGTNTENDHE